MVKGSKAFVQKKGNWLQLTNVKVSGGPHLSVFGDDIDHQ